MNSSKIIRIRGRIVDKEKFAFIEVVSEQDLIKLAETICTPIIIECDSEGYSAVIGPRHIVFIHRKRVS
ncbi:MAG: hypothetical protein DRP01_02385 [Archaeoglobales archaeon]|nr:MAG: hypothetical protein DRP01_02385 [Archaeoglobales archaeon]